ncbi:putative 2OG-Fe(II) oxygenase [uncultured Brevundimonas sp.]|uniref:putative 2OG-Fe(II) oxygenase n=1 Tax=uncultured Brevundimonas sp. TaxID=213418 RepID=UPI0025E00566|nr:putative 2OG-Fe(II) oxygenase [uncultured Brevundimonas sp.]
MNGAGVDRQAVADLIAQGRDEEALALLARAADADVVRGLQADILKRLGRLEEALSLRLLHAAARPASVPVQHNLAALLGDMGRFPEAEAAVRAAQALGGDAPETWLILARALQGQNRYDEADAAYRAVLARRPGQHDAVKELCQLIWMRTGDLEQARVPIESAIAAAPGDALLRMIRSTLMAYAGVSAEQNWRILTDGAPQDRASLEMTAAELIADVDPVRALDHAERAARLAPNDPAAWLILARCRLISGQASEAADILRRLAPVAPDEQLLWALAATAERAGAEVDPVLRLNDHEASVRGWMLQAPTGWPDLKTYLADLAKSLRALHTVKTHPVGQSLRHGTQTQVNLERSDDPAIRAFFQAIDAPIRRHIEALGQGSDPLRRRNRGGYRLAGCWSVQLGPNGFHAAHVHRQGWLSSACYIDLPAAVDGGGREGWISFGVPPFACGDVREPLRVEKPEPGKLVLFPSYMWHETLPFSGDETRLTIAFDVVPA